MWYLLKIFTKRSLVSNNASYVYILLSLKFKEQNAFYRISKIIYHNVIPGQLMHRLISSVVLYLYVHIQEFQAIQKEVFNIILSKTSNIDAEKNCLRFNFLFVDFITNLIIHRWPQYINDTS